MSVGRFLNQRSALDEWMRHIWPTCAKCDKPVDEMRHHLDPMSLHVVITAYCHGDHERVPLDERLFYDPAPILSRIRAGVAFRDKLASAAPALPAVPR